MKRLLRLAARLYPAWWRKRYGAELDALIDDSTSRPMDVLDVLRGACGMHRRQLAIPAVCALLGGCGAAVLTLSRGDVYSSWATVRISSPSQGDARDVTRTEFEEAVRGVVPPGRVQVMLLVERGSEPTSVRIGVTDPVRARARARAERLVRALADRGLEILEPPNTPASPDRPFLAARIVGGSAAGSVMGLALLWVRRRRSTVV